MNNIPNHAQPHASVATTATASTLATLGFTRQMHSALLLVQAVGGDVRFTVNGTDPTASVGLKIADGEFIQINAVEADVAKFITGTGSPKLEIASYLK